MIPFIIFTFAAVGWFIGVIEAMVAAPIVALGLMHPDGSHDVFGKSDQAFMLLTNVFLRPAMMVVGFISGISLSYVGVWLMNQGFAQAAHTVNAGTWGFASAFAPLVLSIVYASLLMSMMNKTFSLIHVVPDKVLRWLSGGQAESLGAESATEATSNAKGAAHEAGERGATDANKGMQAAEKYKDAQTEKKEKAAEKKATQDAAAANVNISTGSNDRNGSSSGGAAPSGSGDSGSR
jgi:defect-in-organelle-trafficking protein DotA